MTTAAMTKGRPGGRPFWVLAPGLLGDYPAVYAIGKLMVPHVGDIHAQRRPLLIEGGRTLDVRLAGDVGP